MALDIQRETASIRNRPGDNFLAMALERIAGHANQVEARLRALESAAPAKTPAPSYSGSPVPAAPRQAPVGNNGLAVIDFADGAHANKTQDHVNDGTDFRRVAAVSAANQTTTPSYASGSISNQANETTTAKVMNATATLLASVTISGATGNVVVMAGGQFENQDVSNPHTWTLTLYKGDNAGTILQEFQSAGIGIVAGGAAAAPMTMETDGSPDPTSQLYTLYGTSSGGQVIFNGGLLAMNFKA